MTADASELAKLNDLLKGFRFAMVTTRTADGRLVAHPLTVQETEFDGDLWFVISRQASAVEHIRLDPTVGVSFSSNDRSEEHTSELQSLMRISYAVFCLKKKKTKKKH